MAKKRSRNAGKFYYVEVDFYGGNVETTMRGPATIAEIEIEAKRLTRDRTYFAKFLVLKPWAVVRTEREVSEMTLAYAPKLLKEP
jgi:hypothetical protein